MHQRHVIYSGHALQTPHLRWVNTMLATSRRLWPSRTNRLTMQGMAHGYLAEFAYRFNQRFDLATMLPRLLCISVQTRPLLHRGLRLSGNS